MDELIKYFQRIETRLAAAEQQLLQQQQCLSAQTAKLDKAQQLLEQLTAQNNRLEQQLSEAGHSYAASPDSAEVDENGLPQVEVELIVSEEDDNDEEREVNIATQENIATQQTEEQPVDTEEETDDTQAVQEEEASEYFEDPQPQLQPQSQPQPQPSEQKTTLAPPLSNIRDGISIGDRFLFQRELFRQDGELMTKTIEHLNSMQSFDEAMSYIRRKFNWDTESTAYELFVSILHRRWQ